MRKHVIKETDIDYLLISELVRLQSYKTEEMYLSIARDLFLFSCFTGFCIEQIKNLKLSHIYRDGDSCNWLRNPNFIERFNDYQEIVLTNLLQTITEKYCKNRSDNNQYLFPELNNDQMLYATNELAKLCKIDKELTANLSYRTYNIYSFNSELIRNSSSNNSIIQHYKDLERKILFKEMSKFNGFL